ncbi:MAG: hypothetical protein H6677_21795 [Candidatus Obscuribacterales bacterium]|nr:hypothetical protein [Cyanobacteria bacterium HKST-UBA01]MCB9470922.1 hypothetical protein [Candidatus Obscuribacterales bacterium]
MKKYIFREFPHVRFPSNDDSLNRLMGRYGGWIQALDPSSEPTTEFLEELESIGYARSEFEAMRFLSSTTEERKSLLIRAAHLRHKILTESGDRLSELQWQAMRPQLQEHDIDDGEIESVISEYVPHLLRWFPPENGNRL